METKQSPGTGSTKLFGMVAIVLVVGIASFFGGVSYQKGHQKTTGTGSLTSSSRFESGRFGGGRMGGFGTVSAISATSITVKDMRSGTGTTYTINSSTTITNNGSTTTANAIQTGEAVIVRTSSSSSTTATEIMVNPSFGGGPVTQGQSSTAGSATIQ